MAGPAARLARAHAHSGTSWPRTCPTSLTPHCDTPPSLQGKRGPNVRELGTPQALPERAWSAWDHSVQTRPRVARSPATGQEHRVSLGDTHLVSRGASNRYSGGSAAPNSTGSTWPHKAGASGCHRSRSSGPETGRVSASLRRPPGSRASSSSRPQTNHDDPDTTVRWACRRIPYECRRQAQSRRWPAKPRSTKATLKLG